MQTKKDIFYQQLHATLAKKYKLPVEDIHYLRDAFIGRGISILFVSSEILKKIKKWSEREKLLSVKSISKSSYVKKLYAHTLNKINQYNKLDQFIVQLTDEILKDITQSPKFIQKGKHNGTR